MTADHSLPGTDFFVSATSSPAIFNPPPVLAVADTTVSCLHTLFAYLLFYCPLGPLSAEKLLKAYGGAAAATTAAMRRSTA